MNKVAIVIPIYKPVMDPSEVASLNQALHILGSYSIRFITYNGLDVNEYRKACTNKNVEFILFDKSYFKNVWTYNKLLISKEFYKRFLSSEYILIYQLDAWVFKDDLLYWCSKGYDYIGAPWYEGFEQADDEAKFIGVGNGGFSLRKVRSAYKALHSFAFVRSFSELKQKCFEDKKITLRQRLMLIREFLLRNNSFHLLNGFDYNEDTFWGEMVPKRMAWFKVADEASAARFSMEVKAPLLYAANNNSLPFGCHAWEKYHTVFWSKFISVS